MEEIDEIKKEKAKLLKKMAKLLMTGNKKNDDKKKIKSKSKKPPKKKAEGLASFTVKELKEKLKSLSLPLSGKKRSREKADRPRHKNHHCRHTR
eukprot:scaffold400162_cov20-Attheya_sp.AAC.1